MTVHLRDRVETLHPRQPITAMADESIRSVAQRLWAESVGIVVVTSGATTVGVLSERDIVKALATGADPDTTTAGEIMTTSVLSVRPQDVLFDVAVPILDHGVRHVPVIRPNFPPRGRASEP